jgi:hypothetical protein
MLIEHWKQIEDNLNYSVSNLGNVRSDRKGKLLAVSYNKRTYTSYARVTLFTNNIRSYRQVHRLVAEAFIPNPSSKTQVDHIDANGLNNRVDNLQWVSPSENINKSFKDTPEVKADICSKGGKLAATTMQNKALIRFTSMLNSRFIKFYPAGELHKNSAVTYQCICGVVRTAAIASKEFRIHAGKCPTCTNTINRSGKSLL